MYIERVIERDVENFLFKGKVLIIYGARQTGKTTAVMHLLEKHAGDVMHFNGDETDVRRILTDCPKETIFRLMGGKHILFIDEAQRIPGIGLTLKRVVDNYKDIQIIVSGSSSLELAGRTEEPLTGRKFEWTLPPLSFEELSAQSNIIYERAMLPTRLVFGSYPEIVTADDSVELRLRALAESYLYRDLLTLQEIRRSDLLDRILRALAFQCGSEVSFREVGGLVGCDEKTIARYIDLLKKSFVIFEIPSYSRNLRNELKRSRKIYFFDNGIRNALINDFREVTLRNDAGILWENYLMSERFKWRLSHAPFTRAYFWRTTQQQEIDLIEENAEGLKAFEFKWNPKKKSRIPSTFTGAYPNVPFQIVHPDNYDEFLCF